jgi:hypothetical protein
VSDPQRALERARGEAARRRAQGGSAAAGPGGPLAETFTEERPSVEALAEWAVIAIDADTLYSTRRGGAPVTALKRLLWRLLRQYLAELEARQTRFNICLLASVQELEQRVERLERGAPARAPDDDGP